MFKLKNKEWSGVKWTNDPNLNKDIYSRMMELIVFCVRSYKDVKIKDYEETIKETVESNLKPEYKIYKEPSLLLALTLTKDKQFHQEAVDLFKEYGDSSKLDILKDCLKKEFPYLKV